MSFVVGSNVWVVYFDAAARRYEPDRLGVVVGVDRRGIRVKRDDGRCVLMSKVAYPAFTTEAEAAEWCNLNLPKSPTAPGD